MRGREGKRPGERYREHRVGRDRPDPGRRFVAFQRDDLTPWNDGAVIVVFYWSDGIAVAAGRMNRSGVIVGVPVNMIVVMAGSDHVGMEPIAVVIVKQHRAAGPDIENQRRDRSNEKERADPKPAATQ